VAHQKCSGGAPDGAPLAGPHTSGAPLGAPLLIISSDVIAVVHIGVPLIGNIDAPLNSFYLVVYPINCM
jgi:hypothetical protein